MHQLWVHLSLRSELVQAGIDRFSAAIAHLGVEVPPPYESGVHVTPMTWPLPSGDRDVYFKIYIEPEASLRFLGRASKARREMLSYQAFEQLGIRCAQWLACGEHRDRIGRLRSAFIVTDTVPGSVMLNQFIENYCSDPMHSASRSLRREVIEQLAAAARTAHAASFYHNDLHWRNILVNGHDTSPKVWWIDCPRGRFLRWSPMKRHYVIKDLACLDRTALTYCTSSERMRFLMHYLQRNGSQARRLARDVQAYRRRRWRDD